MIAIVLSVLYLVGAIVFGLLPFTTSTILLQTLYIGISSAFLAVFLGLVAVNLILNSRDRKNVAAPLLNLIMELAAPLHNDLFIQLGRDTFGSDEFNKLIDIYQKNKRSPEAFSPVVLERLYEMIMSKKQELAGIYLRVEVTARDMASVLGWGYDAKILAAMLATRSEILSITRFMDLSNHDLPAKRKIVENYLDIEGLIGTWLDGLASKLGISLTD